MSSFNKKKILYFKTIFTSSLLVAGASVIVTANFSNSQNIQMSLSSSELSSSNSTRAISGNYEHTNYASFPTNMPQNFTQYNLFAQTNNSNFVQTNSGVLGISSDKKTFFFTSYSGKIIWAHEFASNDIVKKFYESEGWEVTHSSNVTIKEWTLFDESSRTLAVLLGDSNNHQFVTIISLDTGFFVTSDNYTVDVSKAFKALPTADYTNISRATSTTLVVWKSNGVNSAQYLSFNNNALTLTSLNTTTAENSLNNKKLVSFISSQNYLFVYYVESNSYTNTNNNTQYKYKQYLAKVSISGNSISLSGEKQLSDYIGGSTLDITNFKNIFFAVSSNNTRQLVFISGSGTNSHLNAYLIDNSGNLTTNKSLSLQGYSLASVTKGNDNKIYIANNQSTNGNIYLAYVDVSQNSLSLSPIRQSIASANKDYYLVPILSDTSNKYFALQQNNKNNINFLINSSGNYQESTGKMVSKHWKYRTVSNQTIWTAFGRNYLPSSFTWATVSNYFDLSNLNSSTNNFAIQQQSNDNGTLSFRVTFSYVSNFSTSFTESFNVYFHIKNLYGFSSNFVFTWLDTTSTSNDQSDKNKIAKIQELKNSKYGNQITTKDIVDNFFSYSIKKADQTSLTIDESMVRLSYSEYLDSITVTVNIPSTGMPNGFASSGKQTFTKTYSNFLSIKNYLTTTKSSSDITTSIKNIYPSQLTNNLILSSFLNIGSSLSKTENDWTITITEVDDIKGTAKVTAEYNQTSQIPNFDNLPDAVKTKITNILTGITYTGFKSISSNSGWTSTPSFTDFDSSYLPSEIWGQYKAYLNGMVKQSDVILLQKINFSLTSVNDLNTLA